MAIVMEKRAKKFFGIKLKKFWAYLKIWASYAEITFSLRGIIVENRRYFLPSLSFLFYR
jgi:hypothetical protein